MTGWWEQKNHKNGLKLLLPTDKSQNNDQNGPQYPFLSQTSQITWVEAEIIQESEDYNIPNNIQSNLDYLNLDYPNPRISEL